MAHAASLEEPAIHRSCMCHVHLDVLAMCTHGLPMTGECMSDDNDTQQAALSACATNHSQRQAPRMPAFLRLHIHPYIPCLTGPVAQHSPAAGGDVCCQLAQQGLPVGGLHGGGVGGGELLQCLQGSMGWVIVCRRPCCNCHV